MSLAEYQELLVGCLLFQADKLLELSEAYGDAGGQVRAMAASMIEESRTLRAVAGIDRDFRERALSEDEVRSALLFLEGELTRIDSVLRQELEREMGPLEQFQDSDVPPEFSAELEARVLALVETSSRYRIDEVHFRGSLAHLLGTVVYKVWE